MARTEAGIGVDERLSNKTELSGLDVVDCGKPGDRVIGNREHSPTASGVETGREDVSVEMDNDSGGVRSVVAGIAAEELPR